MNLSIVENQCGAIAQISGVSTRAVTKPDELTRLRYRLGPDQPLQSKTWNDFDEDPWYFISTDDRTKLGALSSISVTLVKSSRQYVTIAFDKTSFGWNCNGSKSGPQLSLEIQDKSGGLLFVWENINGEIDLRELYIGCGFKDVHFTSEIGVGDDIFNDAANAAFYITAGTWKGCYRGAEARRARMPKSQSRKRASRKK
jgi:hypothetical protein